MRRGFVRRRLVPAIALLALSVPSSSVATAASTSWFWKVRGFHLTDSSADQRVEFYGTEVAGGLSRGAWRVELAVPAIAIDGPGTIAGTGVGPGAGAGGGLGIGTVSGGAPQGGQTGATSGGGGTPQGSSPGRSTDAFDGSAWADDGTRSGLGDVRVSFRRWLGADGPGGRMSLLGGVKLPTADESEGLGTGETDGWVGVGWIWQGWTIDLDAFVEWVELGRTDLYELDSGPAGGVHASWPLRSLAIETGLEAAASAVPGAETRTWAVAALSGGNRAKLAWRLETFYGLSETATDVGITLTLIPR